VRESTLPLVSVVIPTFNDGAYLVSSLGSVLAQTHQNLEVVVVDDGSADEPWRVVERFGDGRVRYVCHAENRGVGAARNTGVSATSGPFVATLGADDLMVPTNLSRKVVALSECSDAALVTGAAVVIDEDGSPLGVECHDRWNGVVGRHDLFAELVEANPIVDSGTVVRRECLDAIGGFDETLHHAEDWDAWLRLARQYDGVYLREPLIHHRLRPTSARRRNAGAHVDLASLERIVAKNLGDAFDDVFWPSYFRMLHNKVGVVPSRDVLRLYAEGRRRARGRGLPARDVYLITKAAAYGVVPPAWLDSLQRLVRRRRYVTRAPLGGIARCADESSVGRIAS
jgi:glycosyltransferase involved in cell wall biosynthesis